MIATSGAFGWRGRFSERSWLPTSSGRSRSRTSSCAAVTGEDITEHGTGNVGSMNVRRTTGSWGWFALAVLGDGMKGLVPTLVAKAWTLGVPVFSLAAFKPWALTLETVSAIWWQQPLLWVPMAAVAGAVLGHNYSIWMALIEHRFARTGKGLATGGGRAARLRLALLRRGRSWWVWR